MQTTSAIHRISGAIGAKLVSKETFAFNGHENSYYVSLFDRFVFF